MKVIHGQRLFMAGYSFVMYHSSDDDLSQADTTFLSQIGRPSLLVKCGQQMLTCSLISVHCEIITLMLG
jgi:hypothetical protein